MIRKYWRNRSGTWWWAILVIVIPVIGLTSAAIWAVPLLVDVTTPGDRLEAIRIALSVGAGTGGVVALILAGRRQWSTEHDANERRITELYIKAVDQLGSEQAAVRLGGFYALERLANTTPTQRSTIGNVICAYLRMPYTSPPDFDPKFSDDDRKEHDRRVQELETRRAALEILVEHRRSKDETKLWHSLVIRLQRANLADADLVAANLMNANLTGADLTDAKLSGANLSGANLSGANLSNASLTDADLYDADLTGADLTGADLTGAKLWYSWLKDADLTRTDLTHADLTGAHLTGAKLTDAKLTDAQLTDDQREAAT